MALSSLRMAQHLSLIRLRRVTTHCKINDLCPPYACLQSRYYSSSEVRRGVVHYVTSKLQWANNKYEGFLKRRLPRVYVLHHTLSQGLKLLFRDGKEVMQIKARMASHRVEYTDLSYRELEKVRQLRRDVIKAIPVAIIAIPPFANYLVFVLMYLFPRQMLIPHFWTPKQQVEYRQVYHSFRARQHWPLLKGLQQVSSQVKNSQLRSHLDHLCSKVQTGANPKVSEILAVRGLFSGPPLGMNRLSVVQMRQISSFLFLTPRLPGFLIKRRLLGHALELTLLDRALSRLGPHQLSDSEVRQACYVRGLNSDCVSTEKCREWLYQWLQISSSLKESEVSLLLHCLAFLSANYPNKGSHS
ncbi:LETM1 domain-containing protein 1 isoform X2 [Nerophis lumbriciformis]|uniref:LETM1 domain-containing protein 1 isoform X2 n=1 Tax=Nerophis lumbriciformis TaxID=546530 RepID=UPI003BACD11A